MSGLEFRIDELDREIHNLDNDIKGVKQDVTKVTLDLSLLSQRQESNAKSLDNLASTTAANHVAQMRLLTDISKAGNEASSKLGFIRGTLLSLAITTVGGGTAAVTAGNDNVVSFLNVIKDVFL